MHADRKPVQVRWRRIARVSLLACILGVACAQDSGAQSHDWGISFDSSNSQLVSAFKWAKKQALAYVFTGDPVGLRYEAALPGRDAFCMRDVSHQVIGAQVLGLEAFNRNMLRKFAASVAESRDWAGFWEISKDGKPPLLDYRNDQDFWYNLPGNFVVVDASYQAYRWTGDKTYLEDPVFLDFYQRTLGDYIQRWDKDGDGIPESYPMYGDRGLASFNEDPNLHIKVGSDLVSSEYAAYVSYAQIQELRNDLPEARRLREKAAALRRRFNRDWWSRTWQVFNSMELSDGSMYFEGSSSFFPLWFGITDPGTKTVQQLDLVTHLPSPGTFFLDQRNERDARQTEKDLEPHLPGPGVEEMSYIPEIAYRYGRDERGYAILLALADPGLKRREYPEVSFAVVRTIAVGLMGIEPDASRKRVRTVSHLTKQTEWAKLEDIPVFGNRISVTHVGLKKTRFFNQSGELIEWQAAFPGTHEHLFVDGKPQAAKVEQGVSGRPESSILVKVDPNHARAVGIEVAYK